ncbi:12229_t:CDS:2 [Entrophospora sp. SA101]|nr:12229_t:CDS:2 [Entrophospora sp. SA101]
MYSDDVNLIVFDPPLWRQRRATVFDFGCGEGSLLSFLVQPDDETPITRLAGLDIDENILDAAIENCLPWEQDIEFLRITPLTIDLYRGSIDVADERLIGFEALVCMEVIEHVDPPVLDKFFDVVFGTYKPKLVIVTTPNVEFNIYFPQLKYGTSEATLRIEDHRFEWTRQEFQDWCNSGASKYNYSVEFTGVGRLKTSDPAVGFATQIAIFKDLLPGSKPMLSTFDRKYEHVKHIVFPFYEEPEKSVPEILEVIHYYMKYLCNKIKYYFSDDDDDYYNVDSENGKLDENQVNLNELWNIHRIRQLCKSKDKLRDIISTCDDFTLLDKNRILVHRKYEIEVFNNDGYNKFEEQQQWSSPLPTIWNDCDDYWKNDDDENDENNNSQRDQNEINWVL